MTAFHPTGNDFLVDKCAALVELTVQAAPGKEKDALHARALEAIERVSNLEHFGLTNQAHKGLLAMTDADSIERGDAYRLLGIPVPKDEDEDEKATA